MTDKQRENGDNDGERQDGNGREVTCAVMVEFAEPGSAQFTPRIIGSVTSAQILLAASYLELMAERQIHEMWTARATEDARRKMKERAEMAQVRQMLAKDGKP